MLKKILVSIMTIACIISVVPSFAMETTRNIEIVLDDGSYFETVLEEFGLKSSGTKSGRKTLNHKDASGNILWSVKVEGTFKYTGFSSTCTSASGDSSSNASHWKVGKATASKSGNVASAKATGKRYIAFVCVETITKTVKLTCDKNGKLA